MSIIWTYWNGCLDGKIRQEEKGRKKRIRDTGERRGQGDEVRTGQDMQPNRVKEACLWIMVLPLTA